MSSPATAYLSSFARRAGLRLAALTRELAGALAGGDGLRVQQLSYEGQLLHHGLRSCANPNNQLSADQRLYIAGKLLPLLRDIMLAPAATANPLTLSFNALAPRVRGQADATPLVLSGAVSGDVPAGTLLLLTRDGQQLQRQAISTAGSFSFTDPTPGRNYRVELSGTGVFRERVRPLLGAVLAGTLSHEATPAQLALLPVLPAGFVAGVARVSVTGTRNRIFLCVPSRLGLVSKMTQPTDQDADITAAFSHAFVTLDFGADGSETYDVFESSADFLGAFIFDAHL